MATKLRALKVDEISLVDRPANPGARVLLAKREDVTKDMNGVSRFAELLGSLCYLISSSQNEADYEGDKSPVPGALRAWLKSGSAIFRSMAKEEVDELIASLIAKRTFTAAERRRDAKSGAAESDGSFPINDATDLHDAMRAFGRSKNPAKTKAHIRARAKALGLTAELSAAFKREDGAVSKIIEFVKSFGRATDALSESVKSIIDDKTADKAGLIDKTIEQFSEHIEDALEKTLSGDAPGADEGEDLMSPEIKKVLGLADSATDADVTAAVVKLAAAEAVAKAAMSDDEKAHHDGLKSEDAKAKFRAASKEERAIAMRKRDDLPEHVRKALERGEATEKRLAALETERETERFEKRAVEIGMSKAQGELLMKAHKGDAAALKKLEDVLKGLHEQITTGKLFAEFGSANAGAVDAYDEITAKAEVLRKADPKLTIEKAKAKVIEDPANADLMKRYREEQRQKINKAA